jgi:hypothetical protein
MTSTLAAVVGYSSSSLRASPCEGNDDEANVAEHPGLGHGVEAMVEPAKLSSHGPAPSRLLPQERAVAEVDVRQVAERQVALDHLDQIVDFPRHPELEQVAERCDQVVGREQQRLGA